LKVLSINTYGGSLLLAAKLAKMEVVASLEDCGFGSDIQALNFPDVPLVRDIKDWPTKLPGGQKWKDTIVIAHPPCAAFSIQNNATANTSKQGLDAPSFQCHVNVCNYALGNGAAALAIESVPGVLTAKSIYEELASKYKYSVFFVMQNAVSFGVPQWRQRVWTLFLKKKSIGVELRPKYKTLEAVVKHDGIPIEMPTRERKVTDAVLAKLNQPLDELKGRFCDVTAKAFGLKTEEAWHDWIKNKMHGTGYKSVYPYFADPSGFSLTILFNSVWYMYGKMLTDKDMCRIMGFPPNYKWGRRAKQYRTYLSKGVCPPVAAWVLQQLRANLEGPIPTQHSIKHGEVLDLCPKKKEALAAARGER
jgi:site-specific DNA-cytosine methylase